MASADESLKNKERSSLQDENKSADPAKVSPSTTKSIKVELNPSKLSSALSHPKSVATVHEEVDKTSNIHKKAHATTAKALAATKKSEHKAHIASKNTTLTEASVDTYAHSVTESQDTAHFAFNTAQHDLAVARRAPNENANTHKVSAPKPTSAAYEHSLSSNSQNQSAYTNAQSLNSHVDSMKKAQSLLEKQQQQMAALQVELEQRRREMEAKQQAAFYNFAYESNKANAFSCSLDSSGRKTNIEATDNAATIKNDMSEGAGYESVHQSAQKLAVSASLASSTAAKTAASAAAASATAASATAASTSAAATAVSQAFAAGSVAAESASLNDDTDDSLEYLDIDDDDEFAGAPNYGDAMAWARQLPKDTGVGRSAMARYKDRAKATVAQEKIAADVDIVNTNLLRESYGASQAYLLEKVLRHNGVPQSHRSYGSLVSEFGYEGQGSPVVKAQNQDPHKLISDIENFRTKLIAKDFAHTDNLIRHQNFNIDDLSDLKPLTLGQSSIINHPTIAATALNLNRRDFEEFALNLVGIFEPSLISFKAWLNSIKYSAQHQKVLNDLVRLRDEVSEDFAGIGYATEALARLNEIRPYVLDEEFINAPQAQDLNILGLPSDLKGYSLNKNGSLYKNLAQVVWEEDFKRPGNIPFLLNSNFVLDSKALNQGLRGQFLTITKLLEDEAQKEQGIAHVDGLIELKDAYRYFASSYEMLSALTIAGEVDAVDRNYEADAVGQYCLDVLDFVALSGVYDDYGHIIFNLGEQSALTLIDEYNAYLRYLNVRDRLYTKDGAKSTYADTKSLLHPVLGTAQQFKNKALSVSGVDLNLSSPERFDTVKRELASQSYIENAKIKAFYSKYSLNRKVYLYGCAEVLGLELLYPDNNVGFDNSLYQSPIFTSLLKEDVYTKNVSLKEQADLIEHKPLVVEYSSTILGSYDYKLDELLALPSSMDIEDIRALYVSRRRLSFMGSYTASSYHLMTALERITLGGNYFYGANVIARGLITTAQTWHGYKPLKLLDDTYETTLLDVARVIQNVPEMDELYDSKLIDYSSVETFSEDERGHITSFNAFARDGYQMVATPAAMPRGFILRLKYYFENHELLKEHDLSLEEVYDNFFQKVCTLVDKTNHRFVLRFSYLQNQNLSVVWTDDNKEASLACLEVFTKMIGSNIDDLREGKIDDISHNKAFIAEHLYQEATQSNKGNAFCAAPTGSRGYLAKRIDNKVGAQTFMGRCDDIDDEGYRGFMRVVHISFEERLRYIVEKCSCKLLSLAYKPWYKVCLIKGERNPSFKMFFCYTGSGVVSKILCTSDLRDAKRCMKASQALLNNPLIITQVINEDKAYDRLQLIASCCEIPKRILRGKLVNLKSGVVDDDAWDDDDVNSKASSESKKVSTAEDSISKDASAEAHAQSANVSSTNVSSANVSLDTDSALELNSEDTDDLSGSAESVAPQRVKITRSQKIANTVELFNKMRVNHPDFSSLYSHEVELEADESIVLSLEPQLVKSEDDGRALIVELQKAGDPLPKLQSRANRFWLKDENNNDVVLTDDGLPAHDGTSLTRVKADDDVYDVYDYVFSKDAAYKANLIADSKTLYSKIDDIMVEALIPKPLPPSFRELHDAAAEALLASSSSFGVQQERREIFLEAIEKARSYGIPTALLCSVPDDALNTPSGEAIQESNNETQGLNADSNGENDKNKDRLFGLAANRQHFMVAKMIKDEEEKYAKLLQSKGLEQSRLHNDNSATLCVDDSVSFHDHKELNSFAKVDGYYRYIMKKSRKRFASLALNEDLVELFVHFTKKAEPSSHKALDQEAQDKVHSTDVQSSSLFAIPHSYQIPKVQSNAMNTAAKAASDSANAVSDSANAVSDSANAVSDSAVVLGETSAEANDVSVVVADTAKTESYAAEASNVAVATSDAVDAKSDENDASAEAAKPKVKRTRKAKANAQVEKDADLAADSVKSLEVAASEASYETKVKKPRQRKATTKEASTKSAEDKAVSAATLDSSAEPKKRTRKKATAIVEEASSTQADTIAAEVVEKPKRKYTRRKKVDDSALNSSAAISVATESLQSSDTATAVSVEAGADAKFLEAAVKPKRRVRSKKSVAEADSSASSGAASFSAEAVIAASAEAGVKEAAAVVADGDDSALKAKVAIKRTVRRKAVKSAESSANSSVLTKDDAATMELGVTKKTAPKRRTRSTKVESADDAMSVEKPKRRTKSAKDK